MRSPVDLIELPYSFTQLDLLTADKFIKEARRRHVRLSPAQLEGLHRLGLLPPLLRVNRDRRTIVREQHRNPALAHQLAHWESTQAWALHAERTHGHVHDGFAERFLPRRRLKRTVGGREYDASYFLYSQHQLMMLPVLTEGLTHMVFNEDGLVTGLDVSKPWLDFARRRVTAAQEIVIAVSALEPRYYPRIVRKLSLPSHSEFDRYEQWEQRLPVGSMLKWLGIKPLWLRDAAEGLLHQADQVDPLGDWFDVIREAHPDQWALLSGRALSAIDLRLAAEILIRYYEDLSAAGRAKPSPESPKESFTHSEFERRLKPKGSLDSTLTRFGLSPHPNLVLILEGATEILLFPRVMQLVGARLDDSNISIHDAEGVTKSITSLVAYAIAPRGIVEDGGKYLMLARPLTRLLSVMDAEGPLATALMRKERERVWIERILRTLPSEHRTAGVRASIERLVHVEVWNRRGASFEFAHFTDRQIAAAIHDLDRRPRRAALEDLTARLAKLRAQQGNLDKLLYGIPKPALADALWPALEARIERALERGTEARIPIIRVLKRAIDLAGEIPRRNVVIPMNE